MNLDKLIKYLEQEERSKAWLARKINVSPSLMSLMIDGKRTFQETYKNKICSVLNKEYSELFSARGFFLKSFPFVVFPLPTITIMNKVFLDKEQSTFLIKFIEKSINEHPLHTDESESFMLLVAIHNKLTGYKKPKENKIPDESLRGNDSCMSGKCD